MTESLADRALLSSNELSFAQLANVLCDAQLQFALGLNEVATEGAKILFMPRNGLWLDSCAKNATQVEDRCGSLQRAKVTQNLLAVPNAFSIVGNVHS
jgi:hypothetical protein